MSLVVDPNLRIQRRSECKGHYSMLGRLESCMGICSSRFYPSMGFDNRVSTHLNRGLSSISFWSHNLSLVFGRSHLESIIVIYEYCARMVTWDSTFPIQDHTHQISASVLLRILAISIVVPLLLLHPPPHYLFQTNLLSSNYYF